MFALLAQASDSSQQSPFGSFGLLVPAALFFVIFYFIVMRPQSKQQNEHKAFIAKLGKGDEVITASGLIGRIDKVAGDVVFVEIANNVKIRVVKDQIAKAYQAVEEKPAAVEEKKG
ncbi:MAG: preprotein translocase subunit YajC [Myxococcales bacterium]|nr:preprotein translocase subunit YajC [Myxococcales bacterium]